MRNSIDFFATESISLLLIAIQCSTTFINASPRVHSAQTEQIIVGRRSNDTKDLRIEGNKRFASDEDGPQIFMVKPAHPFREDSEKSIDHLKYPAIGDHSLADSLARQHLNEPDTKPDRPEIEGEYGTK